LVLAALITALVPQDLITQYLGGGLGAMLLMLAFGIPLYICATASTPIAAALILQGVSPGAALVFLLVGPATNVASITVLTKVLGKRATAVYLVTLSVAAVAAGLGVDFLYDLTGISPRAAIGQAAELVPEPIQIVCALFLLGLSAPPLWRYVRARVSSRKPAACECGGDACADGCRDEACHDECHCGKDPHDHAH
jgi:hypothetical protein